MVSGKYSVLAGAIAREQAIASVANNLANINTSGYKKSQVSFEALLQGQKQTENGKGINYTRVKQNFTDFEAGAMRQTDNPLDLAIHGKGFFKVLGQDGMRYTRRGDFVINSQGYLTTSNGLPVLDEGNAQVSIPLSGGSKVAVGDDGTVYLLDPDGGRTEVARLAVVDIEDRTKLKREADTTFSLSTPGGEIPAEDSRVIQGSLELSNVNMAEEMALMIDNMRTFETYHKVLKSYSTISEQQEELGTLG
jgi:flagellar basal-body rod protein FlgF